MTGTAHNRLGETTSPYLLQHKDNPVHWQPWDEAALADAKALDRPILLSIGYAACHWCHVMAHESFEDTEVAALMNGLYVNIKVDREERPDIDQIYMAALSAMGEQGGWPLTMVLTPDGKPFWGGTYFPKHSRYGRPGFTDVLVQVEAAYRRQRADIEANAERLQNHLRTQLAGSSETGWITPDAVSHFASSVANIYDPEAGGLRGAPKFPNAPFMETLWRAWMRDRNRDARDRFIETLTAMSLGGIYDHIGGGLARYSVDGSWLVPHFEKMLYDNAHFIRHCVWAHAETGDDLFRIRIEETISWLQDEMAIPAGGFAASLDADSEGEEGKYYVWDSAEIDALLTGAAESFAYAYDISERGNWEGHNIPNLSAWRHDRAQAAAEIAKHMPARAKLLEYRRKRVPPGCDTKVLADWNGYAVRAIAEAARYFGSESWLELAKSRFASLLANQFGEKRLAHVFDGEKSSGFGFATDYAAMISAALALHEATAEKAYADAAADLAAMLKRNHFDIESSRGYWMSERNRTDTPMLAWNDIDEANPSATSQILEALARLALVRDDAELTGHVDELVAHAAGRILQTRFGQAGFMNAVDTVLAARKLVVVGTDRTAPLWRWTTQHPDPRRLDIFHASGEGGAQFPADGAYLCAEMKCSPPVRTDSELELLLENGF